jgi:hypothetical protein
MEFGRALLPVGQFSLAYQRIGYLAVVADSLDSFVLGK